MRYGNPSTKSAIEALLDAGRFSNCGCAALPARDEGVRGHVLGGIRARFRRGYGRASQANATGSAHDFALLECAGGYLDALAQSVRDAWSYEPGKKLVVSFHSIPVSFQAAGDTYPESTKATAEGWRPSWALLPKMWCSPTNRASIRANGLGLSSILSCVVWRPRVRTTLPWCAPFSRSTASRLRMKWALRRVRNSSRQRAKRAPRRRISPISRRLAQPIRLLACWRISLWRRARKAPRPRAFLSRMASLFFLACHKA